MKLKMGIVTMVLAVMLLAFAAPAQEKGKGKANKEQHQQKDKGNHGNNGQPKNVGKGNNANHGNNGNHGNGQGNSAMKNIPGIKNNKGGNNDRSVKADARNAVLNGPRVKDNGVYEWTPETFENRNQYRKGEKVTICHKFNNGDEPAVTLTVSANALKAHMNHGDAMGSCPAYTNNQYSDTYLDRRRDYYNVLQNSNEQILYSRSVLDYALERLGIARQQLTYSQANGLPADEIQRRQLAVTELEQNTSVLQQLIGVATTLVVNKLMR